MSNFIPLCIVRPKFETVIPFQAVCTIPTGMKFFTVIDALKSYTAAAVTPFSTPFGHFHYRRLLSGVTHAGDDNARRASDVFDDLPNTRRTMEDVLVFSQTYEEHVGLWSLCLNGWQPTMSPSTQQNLWLHTRQPSSAATLSTQTILTGSPTHNSHLISYAKEHHRYQVFLRPMSVGRNIL